MKGCLGAGALVEARETSPFHKLDQCQLDLRWIHGGDSSPRQTEEPTLAQGPTSQCSDGQGG